MLLSRVAEDLLWIGRYVERAENVARIADVSFRMGLLPAGGADAGAIWRPAIEITGDPEDYARRHAGYDEASALRYLVLDPDNSSSIVAALGRARDNARATRGTIAVEAWESLNATWLSLRDLDAKTLARRGVREFLDWVKERSHLFRGVAYGTMIHDEAFAFLRLGTFLERAVNTARLLAVRFRETTDFDAPGGPRDYYEWGAILRAVSAFTAYRRIYREAIRPGRVVELLVFRDDMPRSLHACLDEIMNIFKTLGDGKECARLAGGLHGELHYGSINDLLTAPPGEVFGTMADKLNRLGDRIAIDFLMRPNA